MRAWRSRKTGQGGREGFVPRVPETVNRSFHELYTGTVGAIRAATAALAPKPKRVRPGAFPDRHHPATDLGWESWIQPWKETWYRDHPAEHAADMAAEAEHRRRVSAAGREAARLKAEAAAAAEAARQAAMLLPEELPF